MSRVPLRSADGTDADLDGLFARIEAKLHGVPNLYRALGNAPGLLEGWIDFGWRLRDAGSLDRGVCELAILRVAQLCRSEHVWRSHWNLATRAGVDAEKIAGLTEWRESNRYSAAERAALGLADELTLDVTASTDVWQAIDAVFDAAEAVELTLQVAWYSCATRLAAGLDVPLESWHDQVPGLPVPDEQGASAP